MAHVTIEHPLDWGYHYRLRFTYTPGTREFSGSIEGPVDSSGRVEHHLVTLVSLTVAGEAQRFTRFPDASPSLSLILPPHASALFHLDIRLGGSATREGELYGRYRVTAKGVEYAETFQKLTVFETRMLGNERLYRWLPYPRLPLKPPGLHTDLHTHSSGQISATGLMEVAFRNNILYPTRLLDILGITYPRAEVRSTTRFFFPPTDGPFIASLPKEEDGVPLTALSQRDLNTLGAAMSVPSDRQVTFGDLELTVYRYRTPITKVPALGYDLLRTTAQEYAQQGVTYAEITATSTSLLTPDYLTMIHERLPQVEEETGVKLRFLAGMPRNLPDTLLAYEIEKLKLAAASPYIVGVDFIGFEDNKIGELEPFIQQIAEWAQQHDPEFTLRIHAGENRKNLTNVRESLRLAQKYRMRVRIGHAAHGLDEEATQIAEALAREDLVMIEFNPDSNLALNNIDTAEELDLVKCLSREIPFVICSDGGGLFQTDIWQLEETASFTGLGESHIDTIVGHEQHHVTREAQRFIRKIRALPRNFLETIDEEYAALAAKRPLCAEARKGTTAAFENHLRWHKIAHSPESIALATEGKFPLLILGASGERWWRKITPANQEAVANVLTGLVEKLDPPRTYLLIGRPKYAGISTVLSAAVIAHNGQHAESQHLTLMSATVQADQTHLSFTPGLTHVLPLHGSLYTVPHQLVDYVAAHQGMIVFIGGGTFVRDAILIARDSGVTFALMRGPEGASSEKAVMMDPQRQFTNLSELLGLIRREKPELLASDRE